MIYILYIYMYMYTQEIPGRYGIRGLWLYLYEEFRFPHSPVGVDWSSWNSSPCWNLRSTVRGRVFETNADTPQNEKNTAKYSHKRCGLGLLVQHLELLNFCICHLRLPGWVNQIIMSSAHFAVRNMHKVIVYRHKRKQPQVAWNNHYAVRTFLSPNMP